jgi:hypothetical protein
MVLIAASKMYLQATTSEAGCNELWDGRVVISPSAEIDGGSLHLYRRSHGTSEACSVAISNKHFVPIVEIRVDGRVGIEHAGRAAVCCGFGHAGPCRRGA